MRFLAQSASYGAACIEVAVEAAAHGGASRKKGSSTVRCSLLCCEVLSSKIWAFWGCYGAVRDAESDVGAALRRDGRAAAYEGTGA